MLQTQTVEPRTLSLLKRLFQLPAFSKFSLVGGTALSLKYGHRISVDLDLFSHETFDNEQIIQILMSEFEEQFIVQMNKERFGVFGFIQDVKVDIIKHPHPLLQKPEIIDDIRFYHTDDIVAMKINAILGRGRKKDFWDLAEIFKYYTIKESIELYKRKFPSQQLLISIPYALTYFEDAEESEDPVSLKGQTWESIKKFIQKKVSEFLK